MVVVAFASLALFAAPEAAQGGAKAEKPAMERVCVKVEVAGSNLPKKHCEMRPVKVAAESADDKGQEAASKPE